MIRTVTVTATAVDGSNVKGSMDVTISGQNEVVAGSVYLTDIPYVSATDGYNGPYKDKSTGGKTLTLIKTGKITMTFAKGWGTNSYASTLPQATITYNLEGKNYQRFQTYVGRDQATIQKWKCRVLCLFNGVLAYDSGIMSVTTPAQYVDLDVTGKKTLQLVTGPAADGTGHDHADWADAKLTGAWYKNDASLTNIYYALGKTTPAAIGFDPNNTNYDISLPARTTVLPTVSPISSSPKAAVTVTNVTSLPGTATVNITSEDGNCNTNVYH